MHGGAGRWSNARGSGELTTMGPRIIAHGGRDGEEAVERPRRRWPETAAERTTRRRSGIPEVPVLCPLAKGGLVVAWEDDGVVFW